MKNSKGKIKDFEKLSKDELIQSIKNLQKEYDVDESEVLADRINYKELLQTASDIIFVLDMDEKIVYSNSAWKMIYPSMEVNNAIGKNFSEFLPEYEKERAAWVYEKVIKDGESINNEILKTYGENDEVYYFMTSFSALRDKSDEVIGLVGMMKDVTSTIITQKKLKENSRVLEEKVKEQIAQSEEIKNLHDFNEEIIMNVPIGIFSMDPSGIMLSENPALIEIMGREPDDSVVGVNLINQEGFIAAKFHKLFEKATLEKKTVKRRNAKYTPISKTREVLINITMDPIFDKKGNVEKVIVMVEDNTEYAVMLQRANKAEKISSLGFLATGVSTELKNHVNKMAMDLNFVDRNTDEHSPASEYVDSLKMEMDRIKSISEQLYSLSITSEDDKALCEINKLLITHPIDVMLNRIKKSGIEVVIKANKKNPAVNASANQIQQILIQFIENAEDAMPDKGTITIVTDIVEIEEEKYASIVISDTGIGISKENIKRIFQPFFTTKGASGTGLGLMISTTIIENLRGTIGVKSAPGEGTSIMITLPLGDDQ